jgi:ABC-type uncharacterized transport system auxiliary subunit
MVLVRCGIYSFSGASLPPHLKTVAIPLFDNRTPEFGVDQQLTDALVEAVTEDNTLKISDPSAADCVLRGTLMRIEDRAGQYTEQEQASTYRVTVSVQVAFEDLRKRQVLWENTFNQYGSYTENRDDGIAEALDKLTSDIVNKMVSNW